jgi:hypothetical protein
VGTSQTEVTEVKVSWARCTSGYENGERVQATITGGAEVVTYRSTSWTSPVGAAHRRERQDRDHVRRQRNAKPKNERALVGDVLVQ